MTHDELIAQTRAADADRVKASRTGDRGWVQNSVYKLARLAPKLADELEAAHFRIRDLEFYIRTAIGKET